MFRGVYNFCFFDCDFKIGIFLQMTFFYCWVLSLVYPHSLHALNYAGDYGLNAAGGVGSDP